METVKRLFISLIVLLGCSAGAWAIEQDSDGYYLIGSVQDWKDFAAIVETTNDANAKMIADVDLGDVQTMIGTSSSQFKGIFDGLGYSISVNYSTSSVHSLAPFQTINGATIKNIVVDGTIAGFMHCSGLVGYADGNNLISNVIVKATITTTGSHCGGILGHGAYSSTTIKDCLFAGTINGANGNATVGAIWGWSDGGSPVIINCLENGSYNNCSPFAPIFISYSGGPTVTNSYYVNGSSAYGTQVTATMLTDGSVVEGLNNGRTGDDAPWVQDPLTKQPTLKIFATLKQDADDYYLIGSVQDWKNFAELVNSGADPAANAKMIADVDLGDDQTMVGTYHQKYQGTFDGQGHTLIFNYNTAGMSPEPEQRAFSLDFLGAAPFRDIEGATILNLHTAGSVTAQNIGAAGLVGWTYGTNTIEKCWSDVDIVSSNNTADTFAGFVAFQYGTQLNITDCVYTGKIQSTSKISHAGFVAFQRYGKTSLNNCLLLLDKGSDVNTTPYQNLMYYTFVRNHSEHYVTNTINNCYYLTPFGVAQGTQTTDGDISDGTTAAALQADRSEEIWVQDPVLGIPMLKIFAKDITYTVPSSGIGTFSAKGQVLLPEGLKAYYCKTYHKKNSTISVFEIDGNIVPAATGVLLMGEPGEMFTLTGACGEAPTITDNELMAVTEPIHISATDGNYTNFMMSGGKFIRIADDGEDVKMPANRAYLPLLSDAVGNAKSATLLWGTTTGIESLASSTPSKGEGSIYNLNGQKLSSPLKGINIINGRKVIVK